ncbi:efflux RND transporter periplasmic adaptor subunit [Pectobacterium brasiliense]|uniref:efflux RND transporter periplasmic adaptor subunit n=1 Tax=Pectobacterium brasiliense TaxID=180957 RepID=UPI00300DC800
MARSLILISGLTWIALTGCDGQKKIITPPPQPVRAIELQMTHFQNVAVISGEVAPRFQVNLGFRTDGRVAERRVDVGSHVKKGEILARLDNVKKRADLDAAQATLQSAQATLQLKHNIFNRDQKLLKTQVIAQVEWDQAREELSRAQAGADSALAAFNTAKDALAYTDLRSDADGIILSRQLESGQMVAAAQTVFTLAQDGPLDAVFNVPDSHLLNELPGDEVSVSLLSEGNALAAKIREVAPILDESNSTVRLKATLPSSAQWPIGTLVTGHFAAKKQEVMLLPPGALTSRQGNPAVWVIDADKGTVSLHDVTVARYRSQDVVVTSGIEPGMWVVTEGGKFLRKGQLVARELN